MAYSDRTIGFSTGALAKGDFSRALSILRNARIPAVELSALREDELPTLARELPSLDLSGFEYVSVHAPAKFASLHESAVADLLRPAASLELPIVVHPDTIRYPELWRPFGRLLLVENMDKRKPTGRTVQELRPFMAAMPHARFCFDVAHARQVDPTMTEASQMLQSFNESVHEVHASGVNTRSAHGPISNAAAFAYSGIAHLVPRGVPIILESPILESQIREEVEYARAAFSPWLTMVQSIIDDVFDLKVPPLRRLQVESFLDSLQLTNVELSDFDGVVLHMPISQSVSRGDLLTHPRDLLSRLSDAERNQLRTYLLERLRNLCAEFPDIRARYAAQLSCVD